MPGVIDAQIVDEMMGNTRKDVQEGVDNEQVTIAFSAFA
jgi:hypothetical protein